MHSFFIRISFFLALFAFSSAGFSQSTETKKDTVKVKKRKSPVLAMCLSTVVPGLGQAYNKKYWKIPIIYAAMGTTIYLFDANNKIYKEYKQAYISKTDTAMSTIDIYPELTDVQLLEYENQYRRYRDLNVIFTALFYTVNIVDAYVDAHLTTFDVSENLTMHVSPALNFYSLKQKPAVGMTLSFRF